MIRTKYIFFLILPLLFSSCLRIPHDNIYDITAKLDKTIYGISENIVISYTFDGYNGIKKFDGSTRFYGKTYGEIIVTLHKLLPSEVGDIVENEKKSFQIIDTGNLTRRYEDDTLYVRLFNNSEGVPLDEKVVISIDEPGKYRLNVSGIIQPEGYNYDGVTLGIGGYYLCFTVQ